MHSDGHFYTLKFADGVYSTVDEIIIVQSEVYVSPGVCGDEGNGDEDSVEAATDGTHPSQDHLDKDGSSSSEDEKVRRL